MLACASFATEMMVPQKTLTYKKVGKVELTLDVFNPEPHASTDKRPAIIFFFGGGWAGGDSKTVLPAGEGLRCSWSCCHVGKL
jgi:acetyl esterase/lipase